MKIIAVDFDGTIVENAYPAIGDERPFAVRTLRQLQADGYALVLWTSRSGRSLDEAVAWCAARGLEFWAVNAECPDEETHGPARRKIVADCYIDDRNLGGVPDWGVIYALIKGEMAPVYDYAALPNPPRAGGWTRFKELLGKLLSGK